jgi:DedD protein
VTVKERLTGAVILVALMVLLVPELLTGPLRTKSPPAAASRAASAQAGRKAQPPLRTYTLALSMAPSLPQSPAGTAAQPPPATSPSATTPAAGSAPGSATRRPAAPARAPVKGPRRGQGPPRGARARSSLQVAQTPAHRVRRKAAAGASSAGWVVQLGSFADHGNAVRLARSLAARGFRMSVSPARAGARVLWRVRAGPAPNRAGALHLATRLRALGHRGEVLPVR